MFTHNTLFCSIRERTTNRKLAGIFALRKVARTYLSAWSGGQGGEAPLKLTRFVHYGTIFVSKCLHKLPNSVAFVNEQQTGNLQIFALRKVARTFYLSAFAPLK